MGYTTITARVEGRVGWITLDRPDALNAINSVMVREIVAATTSFDDDEAVGCIVIRGSERAFAAGADIKEMSDKDYADLFLRSPFAGWEALAATRTPMVASVAGFAFGGGCELAMMCDVIIAGEHARFAQPETRIGVIPGIGGTQRLPRAIGKFKASYLVLTGRAMSAADAERAGLVSLVVPAEDLERETSEVANEIASRSLPVVYAAKDALLASQESTLTEGLRFERQAFAATFALSDRREGMAAFTEKREPKFEGR